LQESYVNRYVRRSDNLLNKEISSQAHKETYEKGSETRDESKSERIRQ